MAALLGAPPWQFLPSSSREPRAEGRVLDKVGARGRVLDKRYQPQKQLFGVRVRVRVRVRVTVRVRVRVGVEVGLCTEGIHFDLCVDVGLLDSQRVHEGLGLGLEHFFERRSGSN